MKKHFYLSILVCLLSGGWLSSQTVFWSDNFDAPAGGTNNNNAGENWTLNSTGSGSNQWFLRQPNSGGCSSGRMLYISCDASFCSFFGGPGTPVYNAGVASDRTAISPVFSTVGRTNITMSFRHRGVGQANQDYTTIMLSNDGGATWTELPTRYQSQSSCTTRTVQIPVEYENIPNFRFGFHWRNNNSGGSDPPAAIDDIEFSVATNCEAPVANAGTAATICAGESVSIGGSPTGSGGEGAPYTYSWSPATGLDNATVANPQASPAQTTTYTVTVSSGGCSSTSSVTVTVNTPQALTTNPSGTQNLCTGQTLDITAAAGFTNYSWTTPSGAQTGATVQASEAGNYVVTATDANNCVSTSNPVVVNIQDLGTVNVTASGPLQICPGETVTLTADAGYTSYDWGAAGTGQSIVVSEDGVYLVTASNGNCTAQSDPVVVKVSPEQILGITASGPLEFCEGGEVVLKAQSGFTNYVWSNTVTGDSLVVTEPGDYYVSALSASNCTTYSDTLTVSIGTTFVLPVTPSGTVSACEGEVVAFTPQSGLQGYSWSTGSSSEVLSFTADTSTCVTVSATDGTGCVGTSEPVCLDVISQPIPSFTYLQESGNYNVQFTNTSLYGNTYSWNFGMGMTSTDENPLVTYGYDGTFPATLTVTGECGTQTYTANVIVIKTSIEKPDAVAGLVLSPNPGSEFLILSGEVPSFERVQVRLVNLLGQVVLTESFTAQQKFTHTLNLKGQAAGAYLVVVETERGSTIRKWIKE